MQKRLISMVLALSMALTAMPLPALAQSAPPDTAKAAQWCVEQGLLDAKSESSFKPEGWTPKFKTIEVWEKAFPKQ